MKTGHLINEQKRLEKTEAGERNAIEGKFDEAKQRYGLDRVMTRLSDTSESMIQLIVVVMNLKKRLRDFIVMLLETMYSGQFRFRSEILAVTQ